MNAKAMRFLMLVVMLAPWLHGRPEFLVRYASDPFSRSEMQVCGTCHVSPQGGGPRKAFGLAFARNGFLVTEALRKEFPDHFLPTKSTPEIDAQGQKVKVTWAATRENEMVLQVGDTYYKVDRADGTMEKIGGEQAAEFSKPAAPIAPAAQPKITDNLDGETLPTFDYYLGDLPTNRPRPARSLHMRFSHRFEQSFLGKTGAGRDLFGLDSNSVSSFGVEAGLTKWLSFVTYRMPLNSRARQTIEMGPHIYLMQQGGKAPFSLSFRATIEGEYNFTERYTTNFQPIISRSFGTRAEVFVVPTFSIGVPRRTLTFVDFFGNDLPKGETRDNQAAIGLGASIRIRPKVALVGEWIPRVAGFRLTGTSNTFSFAVQRRTNRHVFGLVFSNNSLSSTARMVSDGRGDLRIGFNIYRRLW